jgi:cytochrome c oxidase subunit 3
MSAPFPRRPLLDNRVIGIILLVAIEIMLFTGMIGGFLVVRLSAKRWPPMGAPALDLTSGGIATAVILLYNALLLLAARRAARGETAAGDRLIPVLVRLALLFGALFTVMQILEWRAFVFNPDGLRGYGIDTSPAPAGGFLTLLRWHMSRSMYGAFFFMLTLLHGLHLWIGMLWLAILAAGNKFHARAIALGTRLEMAAWYWHFVGGMWAALYYLLYLSK